MTDRETVRRGYDELADTYADMRSLTDSERVAFEALFDRLDDDDTLLDVGCGNGDPLLARADGEVGATVGLDISREQLRLLGERVPAAGRGQAAMSSLPVTDDGVDAVTALYSLIHVPVEDHVAVLREFRRVLRPSGWLLVSEGYHEWSGSNPDWLDAGAEMTWDIAGREQSREHLREAGFDVRNEWLTDDGLEDEEATWPLFLATPA